MDAPPAGRGSGAQFPSKRPEAGFPDYNRSPALWSSLKSPMRQFRGSRSMRGASDEMRPSSYASSDWLHPVRFDNSGARLGPDRCCPDLRPCFVRARCASRDPVEAWTSTASQETLDGTGPHFTLSTLHARKDATHGSSDRHYQDNDHDQRRLGANSQSLLPLTGLG